MAADLKVRKEMNRVKKQMDDSYIEYLKSVICLKDAEIETQDRRINMMIEFVRDKIPAEDCHKLMNIAYLSPEYHYENYD